MSKKRFFLFASLMMALTLLLAACGGGDDEAKKTDKDQDKGKGKDELFVEDVEAQFPQTTSNDGEVIKDGELTVGLISDSPFEGTLNKVFYEGKPDADVMKWFDENLFDRDGDYMITNTGAAEYELSEDNKTITIKIRDGVNWHDGEPVKSTDLLYSYELLGHPEYTGTRYTFMISNVEGMEEYHNGEAETISGIEIINDKELTITYKEPAPSLLQGIWDTATPRHYVGDVTKGELTMDELVSSEKIRTSPIGFGPYKVSKIVPGESVLYDRNDDYWRGEPALQNVVLKVVSTASAIDALKRGDIDVAPELPTDQYERMVDIENAELLATLQNSYTYIGFKLGKWDEETKQNVPDPNAKLADKRVRQAMWHALNNEAIAQKFYYGLRTPATTLVIPFFDTFHDASNEGRSYDPEKAKELLDEAGYVDVDGDGFREDPDGNEFVLNFASMSGGEIAEPLAQAYIQNWEDVGLKVQLTNGRLHEFNSFYDMLEKDDPNIDIYQGAWGTGTDPDPEGLYGRTAKFNYTRYASEENDKLLEAGNSPEAFDEDYRRDIYNQWQELMVEDVPVAPTLYRYAIHGVNKRVANYTIDATSDLKLHEIGVTE